jgi:hypothetical protein
MDLARAKLVIRNRAAKPIEQLEAASVLSNHADASADDLMACLAIGGHAAELAQIQLINRLKRAEAGLSATPAAAEVVAK